MATSELGEIKRERTGKTGGTVGSRRTCKIGCDSGKVEETKLLDYATSQ